MAIVVEHGNGYSPASAALSYEIGLGQRQREDQQQALDLWLKLQQLAIQKQQFEQQMAEAAARDQLQRDLAGSRNELSALGLAQEAAQREAANQLQRELAGDRNQLQREALNERIRQDRLSRFYGAAGGYGVGGGGGYARRSDPNANYTDIIQSLLRGEQQSASDQAATERQMLSQQEIAQRQAELTQQQGDIQLRNKLATATPDQVREMVRQGEYRYTPEQKTQMLEKKRAQDKVRNDPRFSPTQRAAADARLQQEIYEIEMNPEPVPADEKPLSPQEIAAQNTWVEQDPNTGLSVEWQNETRNNVTRKVPTETGQAVIDNWRDQQETERKKEFALWEKENGIAGTPRDYTPKPLGQTVYESGKEFNELYESVFKTLYDRKDTTGEGPVTPPTDTEVMDEIRRRIRIQQQLRDEMDKANAVLVSSPDELAQLIQSKVLKVGSKVRSPGGKIKTLDEEDIRAAMGQQ